LKGILWKERVSTGTMSEGESAVVILENQNYELLTRKGGSSVQKGLRNCVLKAGNERGSVEMPSGNG